VTAVSYRSCCLTYSLKRAERDLPALSPERVALGRVSLASPLPSISSAAGPRPCSATRRYFGSCPTSRFRSSSACVLRLPIAVCSSLFRRRTRDLPVPEQGVSVHARVSDRADQGAPCDGAAPSVAFATSTASASRSPAACAAGHIFRGSIPGLYVPLSTLRRRPRERLRMTRAVVVR